MPTFTPPTVNQGSSDHFFGRYSIPVGQSVVLRGATYQTVAYPWLGEIADLEEGVEYFLGGRTYTVTSAVATALLADGYTVDDLEGGFGIGGFGEGGFGD